MTLIFLALAAGTLLGYLFRRYRLAFNLARWVTAFSIYVLLFLLGLSVGADGAIIRNLTQLGLQALALSLAALAGSVLFTWLLYRRSFSDMEHEE